MKVMALPFEIENICFLLVLLLLPFLFIISKNFKRSKTPPLPPGPTPWPILGNILHMGKMPHVSLANFARIYGPLISLKLGTKYLVVASSPDAAMEILKTHDRILSGRHVPSAFPYTRSILNHITIGWNEVCDDRWKYMRTLCRTELFSGKALESQECLREEKVMEMVEFLKANEGKVVNIGQIAFATTFNMLSNVFLSRDLISLQDEIADSVMKGLLREVVDVLSAPNLSDLYPILSKLDLQGLRKKAKNLWLRIWSIWEPIVEERRKRKNESSSSQHDFLDTLVDHEFTDDGIQELLLELLTAGSDTSTSTVEWMMAELIKNPEAMKNVREELDREINQGLLKESHIMHLPYLEACLKEILRLHPPAPLLLPRRAPETCQIMNYTIPRNSQVFVNVWAIGRDPNVWEEPLKFKPERFFNSPLDFKGNNFELLPFGAGRRICPGLPMAARHVPLVIASLIHFFDWSLPGGKKPDELDMNELFGVSLLKEHPLLLIPQARK